MLICTDVLYIKQHASYSENCFFPGPSISLFSIPGKISKPDVPVFCDKTNKYPDQSNLIGCHDLKLL